jgi:acyl-CoA hydrolase
MQIRLSRTDCLGDSARDLDQGCVCLPHPAIDLLYEKQYEQGLKQEQPGNEKDKNGHESWIVYGHSRTDNIIGKTERKRALKNNSEAPEGKRVSDSRTSITELVLPNDANTYGNVLGGKVMHLMDLAAAVAAHRHCRKTVVTVSVDSLRFLHPVKVGELMLMDAVVTRAFKTSMEVQVEVKSEDLLTGEQRRTCSGFLTFVAIDAKGRPTSVPPVIAQTDDELRRYGEAQDRRERRLENES